MKKMIVNKRIDQAIFSKMTDILKKIQEEFSILGINIIDVTTYQAVLCQYLKKYYTDESDILDDSQRIIFKIGSDGDNIPEFVTASVLIWGLRKVLIELIEGPLKDLEEIKDKKIKIWAQSLSGEKEVAIDYKRLQIVDPLLAYAISIIHTAKKLLELDPEKLKKIIKEKGSGGTGVDAFSNDFGKARLSSPEFETLLNDLLKAKSEKILNEVVKHPIVAESEHSCVVEFFVEQLKTKLSLSSPPKKQHEKAEILA